jgi:hypothetical protein
MDVLTVILSAVLGYFLLKVDNLEKRINICEDIIRENVSKRRTD